MKAEYILSIIKYAIDAIFPKLTIHFITTQLANSYHKNTLIIQTQIKVMVHPRFKLIRRDARSVVFLFFFMSFDAAIVVRDGEKKVFRYIFISKRP